MIRRHVVRAGQDTDHHARFHCCGPWPYRVGPCIDADLGFNAQQSTIIVRVQSDFVAVFTRVRRRNQVLTAVFDPAHGPIEFGRQRSNGQFLRVEVAFNTEASSDVRCNHSHFAFRNVESACKACAQDMGELRGTVNGQLVESAVAVSKYAAAFQRHAAVSPHTKRSFDTDCGVGTGAFYIAGCSLCFNVKVVAPVLVHKGCIGDGGHIHIPHRRQLFQIDFACLCDVFCLRAGRCNADCNHFSDKTDFFLR